MERTDRLGNRYLRIHLSPEEHRGQVPSSKRQEDKSPKRRNLPSERGARDGARRHPVGHALASAGRRFPVGLHFRQDPKSGFGEMTRDGACGDGWTAPGANVVIETDDVPVLPGFQSLVGDDDVGSLDEGELQVLIGFFGEVSIMDLPSRTGDLGGGTAIGGEGIRMIEAGDVTDLAIDHDRKDISNTWKGFK
jgi:hypothetical protein